jgi:hypothetical protein
MLLDLKPAVVLPSPNYQSFISLRLTLSTATMLDNHGNSAKISRDSKHA